MHPITTRSADCKDCYRCLRVCPVKAISVKGGQAKVREESCILCGRCVLECPQQAKLIRSEVYKVIDYLSTGQKVVLSIAPSFPAFFTKVSLRDLLAQIKSLGFSAVEETSVGAYYTAEEYRRLFIKQEQTTISSCCPVVVNLVEIYFSELIPNLAPVASPMIAHALSIKERWGDETKVVFAGPCIGKMEERGREGKVDAVITFAQLEELLKQGKEDKNSRVSLENEFYWETRLFPLSGGSIRTFAGDKLVNTQVETISGVENCWETLSALKKGKLYTNFIELMACEGGCINGPVMDHNRCIIQRKKDLIDYYNKFQGLPKKKFLNLTESSLIRNFKPRSVNEKKASDKVIREILVQIGKFSPEDEKNCGGCGYNTCRDKAQAVFNGQAELEMCVSYMKEKAESLATTIVNSTPNAIIMFDKDLRIKELNPAAKQIFHLYSLEVGEILSDYMDCEPFLQVIKTGKPLKSFSFYYPELDLYTKHNVVPVYGCKEKLYLAIIEDISENERKRQKMELIKEQTLAKTQEVINKQMLVAQEIAGLLGETTAETKAALLQLIKHINQETERE